MYEVIGFSFKRHQYIIAFFSLKRKFQQQNDIKKTVANNDSPPVKISNSSLECRRTTKRNAQFNFQNDKIQSDKILFNIGGSVFNFSRANLANYKGSMLERRFFDFVSNQNVLYNDIFIARDPKLFSKIYRYLIHGNFDEFILENDFEDLFSESEFYNLKLTDFLPKMTRKKSLKKSLKKLFASILRIFF